MTVLSPERELQRMLRQLRRMPPSDRDAVVAHMPKHLQAQVADRLKPNIVPHERPGPLPGADDMATDNRFSPWLAALLKDSSGLTDVARIALDESRMELFPRARGVNRAPVSRSLLTQLTHYFRGSNRS